MWGVSSIKTVQIATFGEENVKIIYQVLFKITEIKIKEK